MRIGAHIPVAGGLLEGLRHARESECETVQLFPKNPRRWDAPRREPREEDAFRAQCAAAGIAPVFSHASYLINPGTRDEDLWSRSCRALADEIARAERIGATGLVLHLGTRASEDDDGCVRRVVETVRRGFDMASPSSTTLVIENSAGAGSQFGVRIEEVTACLGALRAEGIPSAICIDTCHAFAAGVDLRTADGWSSLTSALEASCGAGSLVLVHANDSKGALGSRLDRHAWIGEGAISESGFAAMFADTRLSHAAAIVEMPGDPMVKDKENVSRLRRLRDAAGEDGDRRR